MKAPKKPRGRPKSDNPAATRFEVRCTEKQKEKWARAADKQGLKLSAWLKQLADKHS